MIESYRFGQIIIDGKVYTSDVIIYPDGKVNDKWWRKEGHLLLPEDIEEVVKSKPEVLVVGTGYSGLMEVPSSTKEWVEAKNIKLLVHPTQKACNFYNELKKSGKKAGACLHLTC
ncbi:Mth938-like domain-containing protein [Candidatus Aerophobetes bacterium]|nr:Mth938-like domain-containing protein [Candidatus Aerophobetes bacterium]